MGRSVVDADAGTRAYILGQAREFRRLMVSTLLNDPENGVEYAQYASDQLSGRVDALAAGKAVLLSRYQLPPGHALCAPAAGRPSDALELGEDNVVRPYERALATDGRR
jgi:hypothetical protein